VALPVADRPLDELGQLVEALVGRVVSHPVPRRKLSGEFRAAPTSLVLMRVNRGVRARMQSVTEQTRAVRAPATRTLSAS
jgi:hypothetical protein